MRRLFPWAAVVFALAIAAAGPAAPSGPDRAQAAREAYARFQALEGVWRGASSKGWTEDVSFRSIAGGSAILETSFDAHPGETMVTLIHLNGEDLDLTHYCVARNQPHLRATVFEDGGRQVTFTFVDGANLPSRDKGHMDKAVFRFEDADHVTTRWTWYQNGQERWMEDIRLVRRR
jgi:hypothetical protein